MRRFNSTQKALLHIMIHVSCISFAGSKNQTNFDVSHQLYKVWTLNHQQKISEAKRSASARGSVFFLPNALIWINWQISKKFWLVITGTKAYRNYATVQF